MDDKAKTCTNMITFILILFVSFCEFRTKILKSHLSFYEKNGSHLGFLLAH